MCVLTAQALPLVKKPLKELLLVNERLGKNLQLNNESLQMQKLFSPPLIVPFVPVSIISLFGLADFQLEAAALGAELLQRSGGGGLQKVLGLCMCFAARKLKGLPPKCFSR